MFCMALFLHKSLVENESCALLPLLFFPEYSNYITVTVLVTANIPRI